MRFKQLEVFLTVAREKSFAKAGRALYISQPAISQYIKKMEEELGFPVFERNRRFVALTRQGEVFYEAADNIEDIYRRALNQCAQITQEQKTTRLGYMGFTGESMLPVLLNEFEKTSPDCEMITQRIQLSQVVSSLLEGKTDMVIAPEVMIEGQDDLEFHPLLKDRLYCMLNIKNPLAEREELTLEDLSGNILLFPPRKLCPKYIQTVIDVMHQKNIDCRCNFNHDIDSAFVKVLSSANTGAIMSGYARPSRAGLVCVPLQTSMDIRVGICCRKNLAENERAFVEMAQRMYRNNNGS